MANQLGRVFNGKEIVKIVPSSSVKDISHTDSRMIRNMNPGIDTEHLGLLTLFENVLNVKVPFWKDAIKGKDYLYVNGREGSLRWDIPMDMEYCKIVENIEEGEFLGIDGLPFKIKTSHPYRPGDIITYDPHDGVQVSVVEDSEVQNTGNGWILTVTLNTKDKEAYFPASKLVAGTQIFKIGSSQGEYSTSAWSGLSGTGTPKTITVEHRLGSPQGVEVSYTDWATSISLNTGNGNKENSYMSENIMRKVFNIGKADGVSDPGAYLAYGYELPGGKMKVARLERLVHLLALAELHAMQASRLMFAHGATITGINGSKRVSEGIYPQLRRGHRFTYRNEIELESMIKQAADVVFSGSAVPVEQRKIKFKGGLEAVNLVRQIFKEVFIKTQPIFADRQLLPGGVDILSGKDRYNLKYESFAIGSAFVSGIGQVEIEHDPSLDYDFGDIVIRGYSGGKSKRTYSLVIWDATDSTYSNVYDKSVLPKGVEVDQRASGKNLFLVKPKGLPDIGWGVETGRMGSRGGNQTSSMQHMGEIFWANTQLDAVIPDLSRVVLIEREDAFTEDAVKFFSN